MKVCVIGTGWTQRTRTGTESLIESFITYTLQPFGLVRMQIFSLLP